MYLRKFNIPKKQLVFWGQSFGIKFFAVKASIKFPSKAMLLSQAKKNLF
jgi:hypothetical protein